MRSAIEVRQLTGGLVRQDVRMHAAMKPYGMSSRRSRTDPEGTRPQVRSATA